MPASSASGAAAAREARFAAWLSAGGARGAWAIGASPHGGRGAFAARALREGEVAVEVPDALVLTADSSLVAAALDDEGVGGKDRRGDTLALALALMVERAAGKDSLWAPYLGVLPASMAHMVHEWPAADLCALRGTSTLALLRGAVPARADGQYPSRVRRAFEEVVVPFAQARGRELGLPALDEGGGPAEVRRRLYEAFSWAAGVVASYAFTLGDGKHEALVPVFDLLNHVTGAVNVRLNHDDSHGVLQMLATRDIAAGEELINCFGELSNGELLRRYGFVEAEAGCAAGARRPPELALLAESAVTRAAVGNAWYLSKAGLEMTDEGSTRQYQARLKLVRTRGLRKKWYAISRDRQTGALRVEPALASRLYVMLCSAAEFERIDKGAEGGRGARSERETWEAVSAAVMGACRDALRALSRANARAVAPAADTASRARQAAAAVVITDERRCLRKMVAACASGEAALAMRKAGWRAGKRRRSVTFRRWAVMRHKSGGARLVHRVGLSTRLTNQRAKG